MKPSDVIRRVGWTQGGYAVVDGEICDAEEILKDLGLPDAIDQIGSVCVMGAIFVSAGDSSKAVDAMVYKLAKAVGRIVDWNDAEGRTKQEVLDMLKGVGL